MVGYVRHPTAANSRGMQPLGGWQTVCQFALIVEFLVSNVATEET